MIWYLALGTMDQAHMDPWADGSMGPWMPRGPTSCRDLEPGPHLALSPLPSSLSLFLNRGGEAPIRGPKWGSALRIDKEGHISAD